MTIFEIFEESTTSLFVNKVRTFLAMLGIIIGIGSVIALMGLGQASQKSVTEQISSLGTNLITINPGSANSGGVRGSMGSAESLTMGDVELLETSPQITTISSVAPSVSQNAQLVAGRNNLNSSVVGTTPEYLTVNNIEMEYGTFFVDRQNTNMSRVVVLGANVVTELFGEDVNPVGERIRIDGQSFTVLGVTAEKGGVGRSSPDDSVYVPLQTAMKVLFGLDSLSSIAVTAIDDNSSELAQEQITAVLLESHGIDNEDEADFRLFSQEDLIETVTEVAGTFTTLLAGVAAISLVVGGIGIMNIMLVTVTERTREIGLRKALGAKKSVIIYQFLIEAVVITVIGGVIGIVCGIGVSYLLSQQMDLPFVISLPSVGLAFAVSVLVGLIFGSYPAKTASDLQPIEALRYE